MSIVPWINPKACLLSRENMYYLSYTTPANWESLVELYEESVHDGVNYYIVAWRDPSNGQPRWECVTEQTLIEQFKLTEIPKNVTEIFCKI